MTLGTCFPFLLWAPGGICICSRFAAVPLMFLFSSWLTLVSPCFFWEKQNCFYCCLASFFVKMKAANKLTLHVWPLLSRTCGVQALTDSSCEVTCPSCQAFSFMSFFFFSSSSCIFSCLQSGHGPQRLDTECSSDTFSLKFWAGKLLSCAVMSYSSGRHLGTVQNEPVGKENGQRVCFT